MSYCTHSANGFSHRHVTASTGTYSWHMAHIVICRLVKNECNFFFSAQPRDWQRRHHFYIFYSFSSLCWLLHWPWSVRAKTVGAAGVETSGVALCYNHSCEKLWDLIFFFLLKRHFMNKWKSKREKNPVNNVLDWATCWSASGEPPSVEEKLQTHTLCFKGTFKIMALYFRSKTTALWCVMQQLKALYSTNRGTYGHILPTPQATSDLHTQVLYASSYAV